MDSMKQTPLYRPNTGLARYGSAPGSLLTSIADSVISEGGGAPYFRSSVIGSAGAGADSSARPMTRFFTDSSPCITSESTCNRAKDAGSGQLQMPSYAPPHHPPRPPPHPPVGEMSSDHDAAAGGSGSHLMRHSSSPAGFFSHLMVDNGFAVTRGLGHYSQPANGGHTMSSSRLKSQLSFSRQEPLSQISELGIPEMGESMVGGNNSDENGGHVGQSYISNNYSLGSWDDTNSIAFSTPSKRSKDNSDDLLNSLSHLESQFSMPTTSLEMATVEKLFQTQQDSVAFKVRAKRGCATHPRSIAERERRTRISEKLRKLQELVPNMDKQTSTADMLDLAVQHIKELQGQVQLLNQERANCTCACKEEHQ